MKLTNAALCALVALIPVSAFAQSGPRQDGKWEVTVEMEMPGMPIKMPPQTMTRCVTREDAADPQRVVPQSGRNTKASSCKVSDYKMVGNTVTWSMKCAPPEEMSGTGEMVYGDGTYKGTMKMSMANGQTMIMKHTGKRVGDCTQSQ
jgi:Protein of unknown function (DUF3617)